MLAVNYRVVREPFIRRQSQPGNAAGMLSPDNPACDRIPDAGGWSYFLGRSTSRQFGLQFRPHSHDRHRTRAGNLVIS